MTIREIPRNEVLFRLITENVEDLVAILDLDGRRIYNSSSYRKILGDPGGLEGSESFAEIHPDDRERIRRIFRETVETGIGRRSEYRFVLKDGSIRYIESQGTVIRDASGSVANVLVVSRDVTERKLAEQERGILQEQLRQAQKLESMGTLAGGIAHDFNNILAILVGYLSLLSKGGEDPKEQRKLIDTMNKTVERGAMLVRQLLSFSRKTDARFEPVNIGAIVEDLANVIKETFPKNITPLIQVGEDIPVVTGDPGQIHQALFNLCLNARDAMPGGGAIGMSISSVPGASLTRRIGGPIEENYVRVSITDTGSGMDAATQERMFEPFFTTKEKGKGTGLGLAVVYGVIKSHRGFVDFESAPDVGTTFNLYFPAQAKKQVVAENPVKVEGDVRGGGETVLVVEDEHVQRDLMTMMLEGKGYKTLSAGDGAEAVDVFRKFKDRIAATVLDIGLPRQTGLEVLLKIKEINPRAHVIIATGYLEPDLKDQLAKAGARGFLQKPYEPGEIFRKIREAVEARGGSGGQ